MSQETNLNVAPYYDDFNPAKDYYKILFKPGQPVQARELTGLQSMLQNQVSSFGQHMFKEGTSVIPGQLSYFSNFYILKIFLGHTYSSDCYSCFINFIIYYFKYFWFLNKCSNSSCLCIRRWSSSR